MTSEIRRRGRGRNARIARSFASARPRPHTENFQETTNANDHQTQLRSRHRRREPVVERSGVCRENAANLWQNDGMQKGYSMRGLGFDNRVAVITGELLASMAGRVAKAFVAETPGMCHPKWTI